MVGNLNIVKGIQMETLLDRLAFISLKLINNDLHRCKGLAEILSFLSKSNSIPDAQFKHRPPSHDLVTKPFQFRTST